MFFYWSEKLLFYFLLSPSTVHFLNVKVVQTRGGAVIAARKLSSAMSAAKAICDHIRDWHNGIPEGSWTSMGVVSGGQYGIPAGIVYSFPVSISVRSWVI